jgi:hypothetical protein
MAKKTNVKSRDPSLKRKTRLTTGMVVGISALSYSSVYSYVKEFWDLFNPGVQQHKRGRSWGADDLGLVLSIRALHHDHLPLAEIHKKLADGWRVENSFPWEHDDRDHLVESYVAVTDETARALFEASRAVRDSRWASNLSMTEHQRIQKLEQRQKELEETIYKLLRHFKLVRELDEKKPWWIRLMGGDE